MAFTIRDLSVLAYANGFTLWHYKPGNDTLPSVSGDNFFAAAADMMAAGDMVLVSGPEGARILAVSTKASDKILTAPLV